VFIVTRSWKRLFLIGPPVGLLALLLIGWFIFNSRAFQQRLQRQVVLRLEAATGGRASMDSMRVRLFPFRVLMSNLKIHAVGSDTPPFLVVRDTELSMGFESFFGPLRLERLALREPQLQIEIQSDGSTNLPKPKVSSDRQELFRVLVERLEVENGSLKLNENRTHLSTTVEGFALSATYRLPTNRYRADLSYEKGQLRLGDRVVDYGLALSVELGRDDLAVQRLLASTQHSKLHAHGRVRNLRAPQGEFNYEGTVHVSEARLFYPKLHGLQGTIQVSGSVNFLEKQWEAIGTLEGTKLSVNKTRIERFNSSFRFQPELLRLENVKVAGLHGRAEGSFTIKSPFQKRQYIADLKFADIGLLDLSQLAGMARARFAGQMQGSLRASWHDNWKNFTGEGRIEISKSPSEVSEHAMTGKILPISGQLQFSLSEWKSHFEQSFLKLGQTHVQFVGTLAPNDVSNLRFEARSGDLRDFAFLVPELQGKGSLVAVVEGRRAAPSFRGNFLVEDLAYRQFHLDQVQGHFEGDRRAVKLQDAELIHQNSRISAHGQIFLDPDRLIPTGDVHLLVDLKEAAIEGLWPIVGRSYPISGKVSGNFMATGRYPQITLEGIAQVRNGGFLDQLYDRGRFEVKYSDPLLELPSLALHLGSGRIQGSAQVNLKEETIRTKLDGLDIPLGQIQWLQIPENPVAGRVRKLEISAEGPYRRPALQGQFDIGDLAIAAEPVGDFATQFQTQGQTLRFETTSLSPSVDLKAGGSIEMNDNLDCTAQLTFKDFVLTPYVKKLFPVVPEKLSSQAEGQVVLSGPLRYREKLVVKGRLQALQINFRDTQLQASKPFDVEVSDERVNIKNALFTGKGTVLNLDGRLDLSRRQRLEFALRGDLDLALLNEFVKKLSAAGSGTVNANIRGTLRQPRIQGQAHISNGQFAYADFPNSFSQVDGTFFFDEDQVKIDNLTAVSGGGKIQTSGDVVFGEEQIKLMNLRIEGREVRIRYPEGMRNVVNADLVLRGSQRDQQLSGNVEIVSASFQKGYDPITEFLQNRQRQTSWVGPKELGGNVSLDLTITGDRNIRLDTALIKMTSRADLKVKGTASNPLVTGSIEASGGELYFQGARYRITRGRLEFINPVRLDPRVDLEAEADLRDYRVVLTINGTADKFRADLRSDPPLPTVDIFSLVSAGGTGGSGVSSSSYRPYATSGRQQESSTAGAAALLSEGLSMQMGSGVKRLFGLDRFRVDPFLVGNERDPSARVTFGQQVTKDFSITYSTSVSSNEQQVILLEYHVSDKMSVIASRDAEGSFGLDVRFRKRLRQKSR
jgi:translocation and assembly module TamB